VGKYLKKDKSEAMLHQFVAKYAVRFSRRHRQKSKNELSSATVPVSTGSFKKIVPVKLLGTRFKARNCISEPGPQEPYRTIFLTTPCNKNYLVKTVHFLSISTGHIRPENSKHIKFRKKSLFLNVEHNIDSSITTI
jgi:hypothetical protein